MRPLSDRDAFGRRSFQTEVLTSTYVDEWARLPQTDAKDDVSEGKKSRSKETDAGESKAHSRCIPGEAQGTETGK